MKSLPASRFPKSSGRLSVAAHVSRRRILVSRDVIASAFSDDGSPQQRILRPRTARKAPVPAGPVEENPPPPQRDARTDDGADRRRQGVEGGPVRIERHREQRGDDYEQGRDRGRYRTPAGDGEDAVRDWEWPRNRDRNQSRDRGRERRWDRERSSYPPDGRDRRRDGGWQSRDSYPPPAPPAPLPVDRKMARSPRYLAVQQLVRVEEEGAYVGLVNGSPSPSTGGAARRRTDPTIDENGAEEDGGTQQHKEEEEDGGAGEGPTSRQRRDGGGRWSPGKEPLDPRDQRLIKELVAGVTRLRRRLDYIVSNLSQQAPSEMSSELRQVLRLGVFELTERHLAPHAVNEHVQLAKVVSGPGAGSFVNGVLRSAARRIEAGTLPTPELRELGAAAGGRSGGGSGGGSSSAREALRVIALQHSHPNWMVSRWLERFGREGAEALLRRNNRPPVYTVRVNTVRQQGQPGPARAAAGPGSSPASAERLLEALAAAGVDAEPSPLLPGEFIRIRSGLQKLLAEGFVSDGSLFVQDESAGLVVSLLDPQPGERLLDCCAAPGGKTLFAAARMQGRGSITALDVSAPRLGALRRAAELAGVAGTVSTHAADLRDWAAETAAEREGGRERARAGSRDRVVRQPEPANLYDKVLLDAPCTGTGVLAKRADLRWRRTLEQLQQLAELQDELLEAAAQFVAPGGVMVYSTCSIEAEEDQERVRAFLERHSGEFELVPATGVSPTTGRLWVPAEVVSAEGFVATLPHVHDTDGAFAARLRRVR